MRELKPPKPEAVWLTASDIAERLKVSRSAAYAILRRLPRFQSGRITRVSEADFLVFVHANTLLPGEQGPLALDQQRQKSAEVLAWLETSRRPKAPKPAGAKAQQAACSQVSDRSVERLTRPTRPRVSFASLRLPKSG